MSDKTTLDTLLLQLAELASNGTLEATLFASLCHALLDLKEYQDSGIATNQLDQYRASVIPMFIDNGEVTICASMSGGAQEHRGMPKELTLMRILDDGAVQRMAQYRHTGLIEGAIDFYAECVEGVTESGKPE